MAEVIIGVTLISLSLLFAVLVLKGEKEKERIFENYKVIVWDEQDCIYVVMDEKTGKQYMLESSFGGYKFRESDVDWTDCKTYIKEHIPGTRRYTS